MEVSIIEREPMIVVGWKTKFISAMSPDATNMAVIGNLWQQAFKFDVVKSLPGALGHPSWGVIWGDPVQTRSHPAELNYLAGIPFSSVPQLPEGMSSHNVPGGTYAMITHRGPMDGLRDTIAQLYQEWLPDSGFEHAGLCDLELYDERFFKEGPDQAFDYFVSVRRAAAPAIAERPAAEEARQPVAAPAPVKKPAPRKAAPKKKPAAKPKKKTPARKSAKKAAVRKKPAAKKSATKPAKKSAKRAKKPAKKRAKKPARKTAKKGAKKAGKKSAKRR